MDTGITVREVLIGTGFYADASAHTAALRFFLTRWLPNTRADRRIVVVDNSAMGLGTDSANGVQVIRCQHNLGHIAQWLNKPNSPRLLGWSLSWILPALVAYSEMRDFIYKEQDCLCYGDWIEAIRPKGLAAVAFGYGCPLACCEQSLFYVRWELIPDFISCYTEMNRPDAEQLPEEKFMELKRRHLWITQFDLPYGRTRPIDFTKRTWYAQKLTKEELDKAPYP